MHRPTVGILALALLATAGVLWIWRPEFDHEQVWVAGLVRVGVGLGTFWLALPDLRRIPRWLLWGVFGSVVGVLLVARLNPRLLVLVCLAFVAYRMLRPRLESWLDATQP